MKNKKIKCDIYTRVSTTMQVDGYSLDAQKEKLKRYAEFQNMEIVNEYSDEGKSGKSVLPGTETQRARGAAALDPGFRAGFLYACPSEQQQRLQQQ